MVTAREQIVTDIASLIAMAGCTVDHHADHELISNVGGELRHSVVGEEGSFGVSMAERAGSRHPLAWGMEADVAQKFLVMHVGAMARSEVGLDLMSLPFELGQEAPGYVVVATEHHDELLHDGHHLAFFHPSSPLHHSVMFSHLVGLTLDDIEARFLEGRTR